MRRFLVILGLAVVLWSGRAVSEEAILGRVVEVRPENGTIAMIPVGEEEIIVVGFRDGRVPERISVGDMVRIWGDRDPASGVFLAGGAGGPSGGGAFHDPTGVRRRLGSQGGPSQGGGQGWRGGRGGR